MCKLLQLLQFRSVSDISSVILWLSDVTTDMASYRRWNLVFLCLSRRWQEPARIVVHDSHLDGSVPCPIAMLNKRRGIVDTVVGLFSNKCLGALPLHRSCLVRFDGQWLYMLWVLIIYDRFLPLRMPCNDQQLVFQFFSTQWRIFWWTMVSGGDNMGA